MYTDVSLQHTSCTIIGKDYVLLFTVKLIIQTGTYILTFFFVYESMTVTALSLCLQMVPDSGPAPRAPEQVQGSSVVPIQAAPKAAPPHVLQGTIPSGHIPKPVIVPDYIG